MGVAAVLAVAACSARGPGKEGAANEEDAPPVAAVQALLLRERLYAGPVDGAPGEATTSAVRRYQILHGMRATGRLDAETLHAMLGQTPLSRALTASDREILRELAEAPRPEPVAERRQPIPSVPPVAVATPSPTPRQGRASKASRSVRHRSAGFSGPHGD